MTKDNRLARLAQEKRYLQSNPIDSVIITYPNNSLDVLLVEITAPEDSVYAGDIFKVQITLEQGYPRGPPRCAMKTPIVHPNIDTNGAICIAALRSQWKPQVKLHEIISEIIDALKHPNPNDELNVRVAQLMKSDPEKFEAEAKEQVMTNRMERGL
jgi:ubiquitin-conjugating enzyme E2 D/E